MSWNQSKEAGSQGRKSAPEFSRWLFVTRITLGIVILGVILTAYFVFLRPTKETGATNAVSIKPALGAIADAGTNVPHAIARSQPKKNKTAEEKRLEEIKYFEDRYGTNMPPGIKTHVFYLKHPPSVYHPKTEYGYLRHPSERMIASLLAVEPGTFILSKPEFGESFNKDFLSSMLDKTEILDTDDDEMRRVKEAVAEAKKSILAQQKSDGKLPNEVLNERAAILYELGQYEQNLENELNAVKNDPNATDEEVKDLFAAANKLRKAKGLPERKIPDFTKRSLRLQKKLLKKKATK